MEKITCIIQTFMQAEYIDSLRHEYNIAFYNEDVPYPEGQVERYPVEEAAEPPFRQVYVRYHLFLLQANPFKNLISRMRTSLG